MDNREKIADARRVIHDTISPNGQERFSQLCHEEGLLWRCACGWDNPDGESCEECGRQQPCPGEEPAAKTAPPANDARPRLMATFRPQRWINDYAIDTGANVTFDATAPFLKQDNDTIRGFRENDYDSDYLAIDLPEYREHSGHPFEVDLDNIDEWCEANGFERLSDLTDEKIAELREKYGVLAP